MHSIVFFCMRSITMISLWELQELNKPSNPKRILMELGSRVRSDNKALLDLLNRSCDECPIDMVLRIGHAVKDINEPDEYGYTLMISACISGRLDLVKAIVEEFHPDLNLRGVEGSTPVTCAAANQLGPLVDYLISQGADPTIKDDYGLCANDYM